MINKEDSDITPILFKYSYKSKLRFITAIFFIILLILLLLNLYCSKTFLQNLSGKVEGSKFQYSLNQLLISFIESEIYDPKISKTITKQEIDLNIQRLLESLKKIHESPSFSSYLSPQWRTKESDLEIEQLLQLGKGYLDVNLGTKQKAELTQQIIPKLLTLIDLWNTEGGILVTFDSGTYAMGNYFGQTFPFIGEKINELYQSLNKGIDKSLNRINDPYLISKVTENFSVILDNFPEVKNNDTLLNLFYDWNTVLEHLPFTIESLKEFNSKVRPILESTREFENELFSFYENLVKNQFYTFLLNVIAAIVITLISAIAVVIAYKRSVNPYAINQLKNSIHALLNGDTKARVTSIEQTAIGEISQNFNKFSQLIETSFEKATEGSNHLLDYSREIKEYMRLLHKSIRKQSEISDKISSISEQLNRATAEISVSFDKADKAVKENIIAVRQGDENIGSVEKNIMIIKDYSFKLLNNLNSFQGMIGNISKIINLIITVVDQANLLSINSSISASKMGSVGVGFSIISNQIRELADQSAHFTLDIENLINTINSELLNISATASMYTEEISKQANDMQLMKNLIQKYITILNEHFSTLGNTRIEIMSKKQSIEKINQLAIHHKELSHRIEEKSKDIEDFINKIESLSQEVIKCFRKINE